MTKRKRKSWRNIKWAKGYRVSSNGEVKYKNKILHQSNSDGYKAVTIKHVSYLVHRLVAEAFIKNPKPKQYNMVNHKNEIKSDNHDYNLEWCDSKYNLNYGSAINKSRIKQSYPIVGIDVSTLQVVIFACVDDAKMFGLSPSSIRHAINHLGLTSGGFRWFRYNEIKDHINVFELYYQSPRFKIKPHNYSRTQPKKVIGTNLKTHKSHVYDTINEAARELDLDPGSVCNCAKGLLRKTHGWSFDYYED